MCSYELSSINGEDCTPGRALLQAAQARLWTRYVRGWREGEKNDVADAIAYERMRDLEETWNLQRP